MRNFWDFTTFFVDFCTRNNLKKKDNQELLTKFYKQNKTSGTFFNA